ncbi:uncharacterized protein J3D65DRAFT_352916 [Phyllosticta citribraziliensis]|uniref:Uncharacterized protein n=1 Tax=Phyllosticta citribraziliensis TaxID=989973 RepID=A0ABR1LRW6_9PEZI
MAAAEATTTHCLFTAHMAPLSVGACVERYFSLFSSLAHDFAWLAGWLLAHHRNLDMPCATSDANSLSFLAHTAAVRQSGRMPREGRCLMRARNLATRGCSRVCRRRWRRKSCWTIGVHSGGCAELVAEFLSRCAGRDSTLFARLVHGRSQVGPP